MRFLECLKSAGKIPHGLWSMMKKSSVSRMQRFMYSQILCLSWKGERTQHQILFGSDSWGGSKKHHNTEFWTQLTENRRNSRGIFSQDSRNFPGFTTLQLGHEVQKFMGKLVEPEQLQGRIISFRCSMTSQEKERQ